MNFRRLKRILEPLWSRDGAISAGRTTFRKIYLREGDRSIHSINIGSSGSGKSRLALHLARQGIDNDESLGVIDPKGDFYQHLLESIYAKCRDSKVKPHRKYVLIDPTGDRVPGFNPLQVPGGEEPYGTCLQLMAVFETMWEDFWGPRMADILRNTLLALMEHDLTLLEAERFLTDGDYRSLLVRELQNRRVHDFWRYRFEPLPGREKRTWVESTLNKVSEFVSSPTVASIIGQRKSSIDFREIIDRGKILLINLPKGQLQPQNAYLLGALIVARINQAAIARTELPENKRNLYHLFVDEFHNYATRNFREILAEARAAGLSLHMITQDFEGIEESLQASILANCQLMFCFRNSREDAEIMAKHLFEATGDKVKFQLRRNGWGEPESNPIYRSVPEEREHRINELVNLKPRQVYLKVRGKDRSPRLMRTITTPEYGSSKREVKEFARKLMKPYTKTKGAVRIRIRRRQRKMEDKIRDAVRNR